MLDLFWDDFDQNFSVINLIIV